MNSSIAIQTLPFLEQPNKEKMYGIIDQVIDYIKNTGLTYEVSAFETTVEGELPQLMKLIEDVTVLCVEQGAREVLAYVKIHYNPKGATPIAEKVNPHR